MLANCRSSQQEQRLQTHVDLHILGPHAQSSRLIVAPRGAGVEAVRDDGLVVRV